jgi:NADPH-dependent F420 reductase
MVAAVVGGTGDLGRAVALRLARAGVAVRVGSRDAARAAEVAAVIAAEAPGADVVGSGNAEAAAAAEVVFVTVPAAVQAETLRGLAEPLAGRILVDTTVSLAPGDPTQVSLPPEGSAAERAAALLGRSRVVAALHTVPAHRLAQGRDLEDCDTLVAGDDAEAKAAVVQLLGAMGLRALDAGPLRNAATLERLTALIIGLNRRYRRRGIGLRFTGL